MAASGQRLIPLNGLNLDVAPQYLKATQARYVKNLYYQLSDLGEAGTDNGAETGVLKPLPSNEIYCPLNLPEGDNYVIGTFSSKETKELYVCAYNSLSNHCIFRVNGLTATGEIIKVDPCFNFQLNPKYFIGEGQCHLEIIYLTDPDTKEQTIKKDFYWTDGFNYQGYLRVDDSIATNGFDPTQFKYFEGDYNKCSLVRMGLPTPDNCIEIDEEPFVLSDAGKNNNIKLTSWQFRILDVDVFGRPSEHGIISDLYYVSNNSCLGASDSLPRCVNLVFDAGNPLIDKKQIEYRNCNDEQWYLDSVIDLYQGSNLGEWWLRERNPNVEYNPDTHKITYSFCKDKLCDPIDTAETNRTAPQLSITSQALTKIGKSISLSNNTDGFPPMNRKELDKVSVKVTPAISNTIGQTANIVIYIRIFNPFRNSYQQVYKLGNDYVFGGIVPSTSNKHIDNIKSDYQQYFAVTGQQGPVGYLAGTNNYAIGEQYYLDSSNEFVKDTDFTINTSRQYFLKFEYSGVPKSNYLFRLASHLADPNSGVDIRETSTYVGGVYSFANLTVGSRKTVYKELKINVCDNDYDTLTSGEMLIMYDMTRPEGGSGGRSKSPNTVLDGYVYETKDATTGKYKNPIELLKVNVAHGISVVTSEITDHNGFYFAGVQFQNPLPMSNISIAGYCSCNYKELAKTMFAFTPVRTTKNIVIGAPSQEGVDTFCPDFETYPCSEILIKGKLQLCNTTTGVPNVSVILGRGGSAITDSNGNFTIIAHDDCYNKFRDDMVYIMGSGCNLTACDGGCIDLKEISFAPCSNCFDRIIDVGTVEVNFTSSRGLLSGGNYIAEITGYDWLGRHGYAQTGKNFEFSIPSLNESKSFGFPTVDMIIPPDVTFDSWVDYITIGITLELNYSGNYIDWIADKVTFVDNSGNENNTSPTQIRIDYASLNQYNANNNFNTTTGWQIIPESTTAPRTADIVQFIRNGDGVFFDNPITALVKYDSTGQYFLINYTESLKDLKENALIRLANPTDCANKDVFFELCGKYKVANGKIVQNTIRLNAFDTYYQYRQIPVPVTTVDNTDPNAPVSTTIIELRQFGFPFEHPGITDLWGYHCWNIGRINVKNPYENVIIHLNQVALSGALSENGQLNYLNYFDSANKVDFNVNNTGGIVAVIIKTGMALIICQYRNFVVGYGDNIARLNSNNIVSVPSGEDKFGKPERATTGDYGCQLFDKNTIREKEGLTQWLDRNRVAILQNDFRETIDVSRYNKSDSTIASWLVQKIKYQQQYNLEHSNTRYFHAVINPANFEWILSEFTVGEDSYINSERDINVSVQETISFDILAKVWKTFLSFTPEYFGYLEGANSGQLLFSFKKGVPYSHSVISKKSWNNFFGTSCERTYRFIFNTDGFKKKKFQSMGVYCPESRYWSDSIKTENKQTSRLLKSWWKKALYFWSANFLCDTSKQVTNAVTDSDNLEGSWIDVRLIGDADDGYSELYGVTVFAEPEEKSGV